MDSRPWAMGELLRRLLSCKNFFISETNEEDLRWVLNGHTIITLGTLCLGHQKREIIPLVSFTKKVRLSIVSVLKWEGPLTSPLSPLGRGMPASGRQGVRESPSDWAKERSFLDKGLHCAAWGDDMEWGGQDTGKKRSRTQPQRVCPEHRAAPSS